MSRSNQLFGPGSSALKLTAFQRAFLAKYEKTFWLRHEVGTTFLEIAANFRGGIPKDGRLVAGIEGGCLPPLPEQRHRWTGC